MVDFCHSKLPTYSPHDRDDLFQEGYLVYVKAAAKHDHTKTKFVTYFWWALRNHYCRLLNSSMKRSMTHISDYDTTESGHVSDSLIPAIDPHCGGVDALPLAVQYEGKDPEAIKLMQQLMDYSEERKQPTKNARVSLSKGLKKILGGRSRKEKDIALRGLTGLLST